MNFDARDFLPSPSDWFCADVGYEGWGRAEFSDPEGSLEGPVSVRFDERGARSPSSARTAARTFASQKKEKETEETPDARLRIGSWQNWR